MKINVAIGQLESTSATVEAGGRSQKWFDGLTKPQQKKYLKDNPKSKFNPANKGKKAAPKKAAAKKAPAKKAAPAKSKKTVLTQKHSDKAQASLKILDKRYDALHDKLKKLEDKQKYKKTPERKELIVKVKARLKTLNKKYDQLRKVVSKVYNAKRAADMKDDPKRLALMDKLEIAQKQAKRHVRESEGGNGFRRAEFARKRAEKIQARIDKHDAKKATKAK